MRLRGQTTWQHTDLSRPAAGGHASRSGHLHDIREATANTPFPEAFLATGPDPPGSAVRHESVVSRWPHCWESAPRLPAPLRALPSQIDSSEGISASATRSSASTSPGRHIRSGGLRRQRQSRPVRPRRGSVRLQAQTCRSGPQGQGGYRHASGGTEPTVRSGSGRRQAWFPTAGNVGAPVASALPSAPVQPAAKASSTGFPQRRPRRSSPPQLLPQLLVDTATTPDPVIVEAESLVLSPRQVRQQVLRFDRWRSSAADVDQWHGINDFS